MAHSAVELKGVVNDEGKEEKPTVCKIMFGVEPKAMSQEQVNANVRKAVRKIICEKALSLKTEISNNLNFPKENEKLKNFVRELSVHRQHMTEYTEKMKKLPRGSFEYKQQEQSKMESENKIEKIMSDIKKIEAKVDCMESCWETFRTNFKDVATKYIEKLIREREDERYEFKDSEGNNGMLSWEDFLPAIEIPGPDGEIVKHKIKYYG